MRNQVNHLKRSSEVNGNSKAAKLLNLAKQRILLRAIVPTSAAALNVGAGDFAVGIAPDRELFACGTFTSLRTSTAGDDGTFTIGAGISMLRSRLIGTLTRAPSLLHHKG